jgi:hypothetical protein
MELIQITRGSATAEELAALVLVVLAARADPAPAADRGAGWRRAATPRAARWGRSPSGARCWPGARTAPATPGPGWCRPARPAPAPAGHLTAH